jgi:hypothetical protein
LVYHSNFFILISEIKFSKIILSFLVILAIFLLLANHHTSIKLYTICINRRCISMYEHISQICIIAKKEAFNFIFSALKLLSIKVGVFDSYWSLSLLLALAIVFQEKLDLFLKWLSVWHTFVNTRTRALIPTAGSRNTRKMCFNLIYGDKNFFNQNKLNTKITRSKDQHIIFILSHRYLRYSSPLVWVISPYQNDLIH